MATAMAPDAPMRGTGECTWVAAYPNVATMPPSRYSAR